MTVEIKETFTANVRFDFKKILKMGNKHVKTFFISKTVVKLLIFYVEVMNSHVVQIDVSRR